MRTSKLRLALRLDLLQGWRVVLRLRRVDTEQSLGPRFGGSRHEGVRYEA